MTILNKVVKTIVTDNELLESYNNNGLLDIPTDLLKYEELRKELKWQDEETEEEQNEIIYNIIEAAIDDKLNNTKKIKEFKIYFK